MHLYSLFAYVLLLVGIVMILGITPEGFVSVLMDFLRPSSKLKYMVDDVQDSKQKGGIYGALLDMKLALEGTGKGALFPFVICAAVVMFGCGIILAFIIDNIWLAPTFAIGLAAIPFSYISRTVSHHTRSIKNELETALSIVSNAYLRSDNIIQAVEENIDYIKPPLRKAFTAFLTDANYVSISTTRALVNLRERVNDQVFYEWVTTLIQCQDDRTMKDNLLPIVSKLTDIRLVNNQIQNIIMSAKMEYYMMLVMLFGSIPLLYTLNIDWFNTLMYTDVGKATQGIIALIALVTWFLMKRFTRPVEYEKK